MDFELIEMKFGDDFIVDDSNINNVDDSNINNGDAKDHINIDKERKNKKKHKKT